MGRGPSPFRRHFTNVPEGSKCQLCDFVVEDDSAFNIGRHLKAKHNDEYKAVKNATSRAEKITRLIVYFIVGMSLPFALTDSPLFIAVCAALDSNYTLPSSSTISGTLIPSLAKEKRQEISKRLSGIPVALTCDLWSGRHCGLSLIALTAHGFDLKTGKLLNFLLGTVEFEGRHNATNIRSAIEDILDDYNITDVVHLTTDAASSMVAAASGRYGFTQMQHSTCYLHCLHNTVTVTIKKTKLSGAAQKTRDFVSKCNVSIIYKTTFEKEQQNSNGNVKKIPLDSKTRWSSTYNMLKTAVETMTAINITIDKESSMDLDKFSSDEISVMIGLKDLLEPFSTATDNLSRRGATFGEVIAATLDIKAKLASYRLMHTSGVVSDFLDVLCPEFESRSAAFLANPVANISLLLDRALAYLQFLTPNQWSDIENTLRQFHGTTQIVPVASPPPAKIARYSSLSSSVPQNSHVVVNSLDDELRRYRLDCSAAYNGESHDYWFSKQKEFPILAKIAQRYLCIQPTSIDSERAFSAVGLMTNADRRGNLSARSITDAILLKANFEALLD